MRIKIILCLPIIIGLIEGKNPCNEVMYIYLKSQKIENLSEKDIRLLNKFENECFKYESSLKEKQKQEKEYLKKLFLNRFSENININDIVFLLNNNELLKISGEENYKIIKSELDKMLTEYKSKIDLYNYWKEKYSVEVATGSSEIDETTYKYYRDMYKDQMGMEWAVAEAKRLATHTPTMTVEKVRNRIFERGETLETKEAKWSDIVSYYGGYSELSKNGITKDDIPKFNIKIIFEKIELTGQKTCLAHVKIYGDVDALKFHKIPKNTYKYEGSYNFDYDMNYKNLFRKEKAQINFNFKSKDFFRKDDFYITLDDLLPFPKNYSKNIKTMIGDLFVPNFSTAYEKTFGGLDSKSDLEYLSSKQILQKAINNYKFNNYKYLNNKGDFGNLDDDILFDDDDDIIFDDKFISQYKKVFGEKRYKLDAINFTSDEMKQKLEDAKLFEPWKFD